MRFDKIIRLLPIEEIDDQPSQRTRLRYLAIYRPRVLRRRHGIRAIRQCRDRIHDVVLQARHCDRIGQYVQPQQPEVRRVRSHKPFVIKSMRIQPLDEIFKVFRACLREMDCRGA